VRTGRGLDEMDWDSWIKESTHHCSRGIIIVRLMFLWIPGGVRGHYDATSPCVVFKEGELSEVFAILFAHLHLVV
jgi:hypothetical protein